MRLAAFLVLVLAVFGAVGYWFFVGWRARDLALKARVNLASANYRVAWLQTVSARGLRPDEPEVLRTSAIVDAAFGRKESLEAWRRLAERQQLTPEDEEQRARAAVRFGDQTQLDEATAALVKASRQGVAVRLRAASKLSRGDLDSAIEEARRGLASSEDPQLRLDLAKLLLRRYGDELTSAPAQGSPAKQAFSEMVATVDALQTDPQLGPAAGAFGLTFLLPPPERQKAWTDRAMSSLEANNPALLPAATVLVDNRYDTVENLHARLRSVFDAAPLDRRAAYAAWLTRHGLPREALTLITAQEAGESPKAFLARTEALGRSGNWDAVIATSETGGNLPESLRLMTRARAEYALRAAALSGAKSVSAALRAAAKEQSLPGAIQMADTFGAQTAVSDTLVELSGDSAAAASVFRLARERFAAAGDQTRLQVAFGRAKQTVPGDPAVRDYGRYSAMIADADAKPDVEGATRDAEAAPADALARVTLALALLRTGQPKEALATFEDITMFYDRLPPGSQAVICAVVAANGDSEVSRSMAKAIDVSKLAPGEKALLGNLR
ncbi:MAG: hypothetical protein JHD33_05895 [Chthoniobacterales bacterium]|nr:hypothetical protein [Chthoniobacterales bacterium]